MGILSILGLETEEERLDRKVEEVVRKYSPHVIGPESGAQGAITEVLHTSRDADEHFESVLDRMGRAETVDTVDSFPSGLRREAGYKTAQAATEVDDEAFDDSFGGFLNRYGSKETIETIQSYYQQRRPNDEAINEGKYKSLTADIGDIARESLSWTDGEEIYDAVLDTIGQYDDIWPASAVANYLSAATTRYDGEEIMERVETLQNDELREELDNYADKEDLSIQVGRKVRDVKS